MLAELPGAAATAAAAATSFDQRCAVCVVRSEELTEGYARDCHRICSYLGT